MFYIKTIIFFHESSKKKLEEEMKKIGTRDEKLEKNISYHSQMVIIWRGNEKKLRKQIESNSQ